jgi:uncharacterized membrane protein YgdD (TMEM256/DUF423 family)
VRRALPCVCIMHHIHRSHCSVRLCVFVLLALGAAVTAIGSPRAAAAESRETALPYRMSAALAVVICDVHHTDSF